MRPKRRYYKKRLGFPAVVICALLLPVFIAAIMSGLPQLSQVGERAGVFAALLAAPLGGIDVLLESLHPPAPPAATAETGTAAAQSPPPTPEAVLTHDELPPDELFNYAEIIRRNLPDAVKPEDIPEANRGVILRETFATKGSGGFVSYDGGYIKNYTKLSEDDIEDILLKKVFSFNSAKADDTQPAVLIVHTHATEAYEPYDRDFYDTRYSWRSTVNSENMVRVGDALEKTLAKNGITVIHDTTQHDYPSYNGSYERSAETIKAYLEEYPSIKIVLDIHRDGIQRDNKTIVKPVAEINGKTAAQLMIIAGCDDGTLDMPKWRENLRFAASLQSELESRYPGLARPVMFCYRKYNMDLTTGSLLIEIGSNANTLDEAVYTAELLGKSLAAMLK